MGSAPFALFPRVIRAPVFGRAYSAPPALFHADLYGILRKLEGEGPKYFAGDENLPAIRGDPKKAAASNEKE